MKQRLASLITLTLSLAACGKVGTGLDEEAGGDAGSDHRADSGPVDPAVPTVLSVSPADGARGVAPDADITVVFSHPMDAASVEAAWSSDDLPADAVAFSWNAAGDTLTVAPEEPLPVAEGSAGDPDAVEPLTIGFAIGTAGLDEDGVALGQPLEIEFRTVRRLSLEVPYHAPLSDCRYKASSAAFGDEALFAGDDSENQQIKMVVSFALPEPPTGAVLERAVFVSDHRGIFGQDAYQGLGELRLSHVRFTALSGSFIVPALGRANVLSDDPEAGPRSVSVTGAVADDYADDLAYAQFRAEFPTATDGDGEGEIAVFGRADFALALDYLVE